MNLLFPNAKEGTLILQISSISILFTVLEQTINGALQGIGKIMTPTIALTVGVMVKFILNLILVQNPKYGTAGAALATSVCHVVAFIIGYVVLQKKLKLDLKPSKFIFKPSLATIIMAICSKSVYFILSDVIKEKIAAIIAILTAIIVYMLCILILKIFSKEEISKIIQRKHTQ